MQTLDRAKLIVRAQVSDLLTKLEDGQKTRQLVLEEVRDDIRGIKSLVVNAIADLFLRRNGQRTIGLVQNYQYRRRKIDGPRATQRRLYRPVAF